MKSLALSSLVAFALLAGCASPTESPDVTESDLVAPPPPTRVELPPTWEAGSVQVKLFGLLDAFRGDPEIGVVSAIESSSLMVVGAPESGVPVRRSLACTSSDLEAVGPGGDGFTHVTLYGCTLDAFAPAASGATLPEVHVPWHGEAPLAGKLFALLEKGAERGDLGVEHTVSSEGEPSCCDMLYTDTYALSDAAATLACTRTVGGIAGLHTAQCTFTWHDAR